jgi:hypothetical protein
VFVIFIMFVRNGLVGLALSLRKRKAFRA